MIEVDNISFEYTMLDKPVDALKLLFKKPVKTYKVLENISFTVKEGEVLGVLGRNGAGKSTLLKLLAGLLVPTSGKISYKGRISSILEVGTGMSPLLSGRENIRRRLFLQGCSSKEIQELEKEIIEFSELEEVIDQPVRTYSTGMGARLIFAIVTSGIGEILLIDELIVTGDELFQGKCVKRINEICRSGRTIVIASHAIDFIERLCTRAIWLENCKIKMSGSGHDVGVAYLETPVSQLHNIYKREYAEIEDFQLNSNDPDISLSISINCKKPAKDLSLQVIFRDVMFGTPVFLLNTQLQGKSIGSQVGRFKLSLNISRPPGLRRCLIGFSLIRGNFYDATSCVVEDSWGWSNGKIITFSVDGPAPEYYLAPDAEWEICT